MAKRVYNKFTLPEPSVEKGRWMNGRGICLYLGIGTSTLHRYVMAGIIPYSLRKTAAGGFKKMYNTLLCDQAMEPKQLNSYIN